MRFPSDVPTTLRHLENAQWWPAAVLQRRQFELLAELALHAYRTVPFYRKRFDAAGLSPEQVAQPHYWRELPVLTRSDVQQAGESLHSSAVPSVHGEVSQKWTGGSTGRPVMVLGTDVTDRFWRASTIREHKWHRRDFQQKMAVIRHIPDGGAMAPEGVTLDGWGIVTAGLIRTGPCAVLNIQSTTDEQVEWLKREEPTYLQSHPTVLHALSVRFAEFGTRLRSLRQMHTFGEVLEPNVRQTCREALGVEICDSYSSNEVGNIAIQCGPEGCYHVQAEHLFVEVLDEKGGSCIPGQTGRVVLTALDNFASPLLRYEIGDYAEVGSLCPCGRNLPTLTRVLGRKRNMFVLPSGEKRWPALDIDPDSAFAGKLPIQQYQVVQRDLTDIEVRLVAPRALAESEQRAITNMLENWFGHSLQVTFSYVDSIPRSPTGKFEDFRCEVPGDRKLNQQG